MFTGAVEFRASVKNNPIAFSEVSVRGGDPVIEMITLQSDKTNGITLSVTIKEVTTKEDGLRIARDEADAVLDTLAFERHIAIASPRLISQAFQPTMESDGQQTIPVGVSICLKPDTTEISRVDSKTIKKQIVGSTSVSAMHKRMFREAVRSRDGVERFMHLYNLLMMLHGDLQGRLDMFIHEQEPNVTQTPSPHSKGVNETIYTRLRNELAHHRSGVNIETTKQEMIQQVGQLVQHARAAIATQPTTKSSATKPKTSVAATPFGVRSDASENPPR